MTNLSLNQNADFFQYRIQFVVNELENWIAPDLDSMKIIADHAGFTSNIPQAVNPLSEPVIFQTTHDSMSDGEMILQFALCDSFGALDSGWSKLSFDGNSLSEIDSENIIRTVTVTTNSSNEGATILNWSVEFEDLNGASNICTKVATAGDNLIEYLHDQPIEIDYELALSITITGINEYNTTVGGTELSITIDHVFPSYIFNIKWRRSTKRESISIFKKLMLSKNEILGWTNYTTPWQGLLVGESNAISWNLPSHISGLIHVSIEGFSNSSLQIISDQTPIVLTLDNSNPVIFYQRIRRLANTLTVRQIDMFPLFLLMFLDLILIT